MHIPFCAHKCHYCDFNSHVRPAPDWPLYARALLRELEARLASPAFAGRQVASVFFGGGTPSLAPPSLFAAILDALAARGLLAADAEVTMEANPGSSEAARFADCRRAGVNRLSIGVQSLDVDELRWLERIHDPAEARQAFAAARKAGFANINLDLMYSLPGQPLARWLATLDAAIALEPEHLSCYQLTIEPRTRLAARHRKQPLPMPDEATALDFLTATNDRLARAGYRRYEISNHARPGFACRHNDAYWRYHDYIGIGAGAAGKHDTADGGCRRWRNRNAPEGYVRAVLAHGLAEQESESLDRASAAGEACWLGLRRADGVDRRAFVRRFGFDAWDGFGPSLMRWLRAGHLQVDAAGIRITASGLPLTDAIAADALGAISEIPPSAPLPPAPEAGSR